MQRSRDRHIELVECMRQCHSTNSIQLGKRLGESHSAVWVEASDPTANDVNSRNNAYRGLISILFPMGFWNLVALELP